MIIEREGKARKQKQETPARRNAKSTRAATTPLTKNITGRKLREASFKARQRVEERSKG